MSFVDTFDDLRFGSKVKALNLAPLQPEDAGKTLIWDGTKWVVGNSGMSDLEFLQKKLDENNLVVVHGSIAAVNSTVAYTVPNGKTFYHVRTTITDPNTTGSVYAELVNILNDTTIIDRLSATAAEDYNNPNGAAYQPKIVSETPTKIVGDGAKQFKVQKAGGTNTLYVTIVGYLV
jgi:hypothetical protein